MFVAVNFTKHSKGANWFSMKIQHVSGYLLNIKDQGPILRYNVYLWRRKMAKLDRYMVHFWIYIVLIHHFNNSWHHWHHFQCHIQIQLYWLSWRVNTIVGMRAMYIFSSIKTFSSYPYSYSGNLLYSIIWFFDWFLPNFYAITIYN